MTVDDRPVEAAPFAAVSARRLVAVSLVAFVLAAAGNFFWDERVIPETDYGDPIYQPNADDRLVSSLRSAPGSSYRELFFAVTGLLDVASGGVLIVPGPDIVSEPWIENLARMELRIDSYPFQIDQDTFERLLPHTLFEGEGWLGGPGSQEGEFRIVAISDEPVVMRLVFHEDTALFVEDTLLGGSG